LPESFKVCRRVLQYEKIGFTVCVRVLQYMYVRVLRSMFEGLTACQRVVQCVRGVNSMPEGFTACQRV
jgi:hypothetical protein